MKSSLFHGYQDIFNNQSNFQFAFTIFSLLLLFGIVLLSQLQYFPVSFGHVTNQFGNITVETGWSIEPPLVDEMNNIIINVNRQDEQANDTSQSTLIPVRNALSQMNVEVKHGGITKQLNFVPSVETSGGYEASIIPSRIGSYSIILNGTIAGQIINAEIPIENAEGKESLIFPQSQDGASSVNSAQDNADAAIIGSNLRTILSGLENNIRTNADNMSTFINNTQRLQDSVNGQVDYLNSLYLVSVSSIGISVGAIMISAFALKRKSSRL